MGPHRVILEHDADVAAFGRDINPAGCAEQAGISYPDLTGFGFAQPQQAPYQGGFSASGGAYQAENLTAVHFHAEIFQHLVIAVPEGDILKHYICHRLLLLTIGMGAV